MREVAALAGDRSPLQSSMRACLASILDCELAAVPQAAGANAAWARWHNWLASRGLGLVPVHDPSRFEWPGPWIAVLGGEVAGGSTAVVAFGAPPGVALDPLASGLAFETVTAGYVVAAADVSLWSQRASPQPTAGRVELIAVAEHAGAAMQVLDEASAHAGGGLDGDRYRRGEGTFSDPDSRGHDLTLIEAEALEALAGDDMALRPEDARRNVVTRGIDLNALVGRRFRVGEVHCLGQRLCEPCVRLERLTTPGVLRGLVHRGGLRADVLSDGVIRVGDPVAPENLRYPHHAVR